MINDKHEIQEESSEEEFFDFLANQIDDRFQKQIFHLIKEHPGVTETNEILRKIIDLGDKQDD